MTDALRERVRSAIAAVDDPEYPGISITDLGLVEALDVTPDGNVVVGLIPTFSGCPALSMIADDVRSAVAALDGVTTVDVRWLGAPVWTIDRVTDVARPPWPGSSPSRSASVGSRCPARAVDRPPWRTRCSDPAAAGRCTSVRRAPRSSK